MGIEPMTSSLPRKCPTTEPQQLVVFIEHLSRLELVSHAYEASASPSMLKMLLGA